MKHLSWLRNPWVLLTLLILGAGGYATFLRFYHGLGASTNLSDEFPWGLWVGFDVICGVGLAAGGFTICAMVHILRMKEYQPLLRPAVLTAFIGYVLVVGGLMYDLGHPWRIWHPIVMWNPHSVMFEVAWCVTLYTTVLAAEVSILFFERFEWRRAAAIAHGLAFPLALASVLLSMLHQSSLGSLFLIVPGRLHAFWYTPLLPLLFFLSAMGAGLAMAIVESNLVSRGLGHQLPRIALQGAARVAAVVVGLYLVIRLADLVRTGALLELRVDDRASWFFLLEMAGFILPMILFSLSTVRRNQRYLYRAAQILVVGFLVNRLNVSITGFEVVSGTTYTPAWTEVAVTAMIVTAGVWAVYLAERYLPVLEPDPHAVERQRRFEAEAWVARVDGARPALAPGSGSNET
jgi:Ni/Fe-hydrogenase subunit HybB-like protein